VIYQVYPRSFADSNGDGIGDLRGIEAHLDHLRGGPDALGVDALWLSPIYPSPLADFGYDISDYTGVAAEYGTLEDLDRLIGACHERGLKLLLDLVPCHTSIHHPWFVDSRSSRGSSRRDWFIWADPGHGGGAPNNWQSVFGGSAWELDPATGQYYLHTFYPEQPDLNWRNPAVADAIHDVMRFWFARGVDGFRVDAISAAIKDELMRDNPPFSRGATIPGLGADAAGQELLWSLERPEVHDVVRGLRRVADDYPDRVMIGEVYLPVERLAGYLGHGRDDAFQLAFDFELLLSPWSHRDFALAVERAEALHPPGTWPTFALSNHDRPRHATRYGRARARLAALILLTLRGVPVLYAGEEIGMVDAASEILPSPPFDRAGRDGQRTPMQWDSSPAGGFTRGTPWLPLVDPAQANVADQQGDPGSLLQLYRRLIDARSRFAALRFGQHRTVWGAAPDVMAWRRELDGERLLVIANMASKRRVAELGGIGTRAEVVVATGPRSGEIGLDRLPLDPLEGLVVRLR
jgi:alpha-glucosidase